MRALTDEEVALGPLLPELIHTSVLDEVGNATIRLVDGSVPLPIRRAIARVAYVAQRSMPAYMAGYDGTVTEDDQRLYVLSRETRAIGIVLTALQNRSWRVEWSKEGALYRLTDAPCQTRLPVIARIWVASTNRRTGLGRKIVECAIAHLGLSASAVGWELPFTSYGAIFVKALFPSTFLISCDIVTLKKNTKLKPLS